MRYIKALLLVVIFFLAIIFFFQNQAILNKDTVLTMNLFFIKPWNSIPLPLYFLLLLGFLFGALITLLLLVWDKFCNSAKLMKSNWRLRSLEKEVLQLQSSLNAAKKKAAEALPPAKHETLVANNLSEAKPAEAKAEAHKEEKPAEAKVEEKVEKK